MKTLLIPVGVVGCGKTELAKLLQARISLIHIQNDDIKNGHLKKRMFADALLEAFTSSDIVFADRNNHLKMHRRELIDLFRGKYLDGRIVVLDWRVDRVEEEALRKICSTNIKARGDGHQSLKASNPSLSVIINSFIKDYCPFDKSEGDCEVVELGVTDSREANLKRVLDVLKST